MEIRIKLKSYDHRLLDKTVTRLVKALQLTGAVIIGPVPLPTKKRIFTVLRSPHVNKKSREQFQLSCFKRILDVYSSNNNPLDTLTTFDMPSGVEVNLEDKTHKA